MLSACDGEVIASADVKKRRRKRRKVSKVRKEEKKGFFSKAFGSNNFFKAQKKGMFTCPFFVLYLLLLGKQEGNIL